MTAEPARLLAQLVMGFRITQMIHVAARLELADAVRHEPLTPEALAAKRNFHPGALRRLLRALASVGIFIERPDGAYASTPLSRLLEEEAPGSLRPMALLYGEEWVWSAYGQMLHSVQTGKPAFDFTHNQSFYAYLDAHPDAAATFQQAMSSFSAHEAEAILSAYDFSRMQKVVDVGGGHGVLAAQLLRRYPEISTVVLDLPRVIQAADAQATLEEFSPRAAYVAGDFFLDVPQGGDLYVLKSVLHNWEDDAAVRILRTVRRAMTSAARLLVIERVIPAGDGPSEAKLFDINMLTITGGQERSAQEYDVLFQAAGLRTIRVIPTVSALTLIECATA